MNRKQTVFLMMFSSIIMFVWFYLSVTLTGEFGEYVRVLSTMILAILGFFSFVGVLIIFYEWLGTK